MNINMLKRINFSNINLECLKKENKFKIYNKNNFMNINVRILPKFIELKDSNFKEKAEFCIKKFVMTLLENCDNINLEYFKNNFKRLEFSSNKLEYMNKVNGFIAGAYDIFCNKMYIYDFNAIYHELLHMSSTCFNKGYIFSGFAIDNQFKSRINNYFNEGYTQLLTERYFADDSKGKVYELAVSSVSIIEKLVGKDTMEKLYFNADFMGLVYELEKYYAIEEIVDFFGALEFFYIPNKYKIDEAVRMQNISDELVDTKMDIIVDFLSNCDKKIKKKTILK